MLILLVMERAQSHASGEEGDNFVHVQKMPGVTGIGGDPESDIDGDALKRSMKPLIYLLPKLSALIKVQSGE